MYTIPMCSIAKHNSFEIGWFSAKLMSGEHPELCRECLTQEVHIDRCTMTGKYKRWLKDEHFISISTQVHAMKTYGVTNKY